MKIYQAYHRVSFIWPDGVKLEVVDSKAKGTGELEYITAFEGTAVYGERSVVSTSETVPPLSVWLDPEAVFFPFCLRENTAYEIDVFIPSSKEYCKQQALRSSNSVWPFVESRLEGHINITQPRLWGDVKEETRESTLIVSFVNMAEHVGVVNLSLLNEEHAVYFEVLSSKINYAEEFKALLDDLAQEHLHLVYQVDSPSSIHLRGNIEGDSDLTTILFHLRNVMAEKNLPEAMETIFNAPLSELVYEHDVISSSLVEDIDPIYLISEISELEVSRGGPLSRLMRGHSPINVPVQIENETRDTPENRYIKAFLLNLQELVFNLEQRLIQSDKKMALLQVRNWNQLIFDWLSSSLWNEVGSMEAFPSNSQRLQKSSGYRDVLIFDMQLTEGLSLPWSSIEQLSNNNILGDVRPVFELYEYWCFFVIRKILISLFGEEKNDASLLERNYAGLEVRLSRGVTSQLQFEYNDGASSATIILFYNRNFESGKSEEWGTWSGSYSTLFHPDISIAVVLPRQTHWLHFDAKYKLDVKSWRKAIENIQQEQIAVERRLEEMGKYKRADLYKMHCYRDAILGTRGAYLLYPGRRVDPANDDIFVRVGQGMEYASKIPSVGAFALCPGIESPEKQINNIEKFIGDTIFALINANVYQEEYGLNDLV